MKQRGQFAWLSDAFEVTVITVVFVLVYTAVGIGAIGTPIAAGFRRIRQPKS